ncbi:MAG: hypothetical protein M1834_004249 [Cirrosporium novae-zelandiae]|nr:MAG: hypothetical protein M1834_004249 [Cirrosporium novae-zelandiae]
MGKYDQWQRPQLQAELRSRHMPATGATATLVKRLSEADITDKYASERYSKLKKTELQDELKNRGLIVTGNKPILIQRLIDSDEKEELVDEDEPNYPSPPLPQQPPPPPLPQQPPPLPQQPPPLPQQLPFPQQPPPLPQQLPLPQQPLPPPQQPPPLPQQLPLPQQPLPLPQQLPFPQQPLPPPQQPPPLPQQLPPPQQPPLPQRVPQPQPPRQSPQKYPIPQLSQTDFLSQTSIPNIKYTVEQELQKNGFSQSIPIVEMDIDQLGPTGTKRKPESEESEKSSKAHKLLKLSGKTPSRQHQIEIQQAAAQQAAAQQAAAQQAASEQAAAQQAAAQQAAAQQAAAQQAAAQQAASEQAASEQAASEQAAAQPKTPSTNNKIFKDLSARCNEYMAKYGKTRLEFSGYLLQSILNSEEIKKILKKVDLQGNSTDEDVRGCQFFILGKENFDLLTSTFEDVAIDDNRFPNIDIAALDSAKNMYRYIHPDKFNANEVFLKEKANEATKILHKVRDILFKHVTDHYALDGILIPEADPIPKYPAYLQNLPPQGTQMTLYQTNYQTLTDEMHAMFRDPYNNTVTQNLHQKIEIINSTIYHTNKELKIQEIFGLIDESKIVQAFRVNQRTHMEDKKLCFDDIDIEAAANDIRDLCLQKDYPLTWIPAKDLNAPILSLKDEFLQHPHSNLPSKQTLYNQSSAMTSGTFWAYPYKSKHQEGYLQPILQSYEQNVEYRKGFTIDGFPILAYRKIGRLGFQFLVKFSERYFALLPERECGGIWVRDLNVPMDENGNVNESEAVEKIGKYADEASKRAAEIRASKPRLIGIAQAPRSMPPRYSVRYGDLPSRMNEPVVAICLSWSGNQWWLYKTCLNAILGEGVVSAYIRSCTIPTKALPSSAPQGLIQYPSQGLEAIPRYNLRALPEPNPVQDRQRVLLSFPTSEPQQQTNSYYGPFNSTASFNQQSQYGSPPVPLAPPVSTQQPQYDSPPAPPVPTQYSSSPAPPVSTRQPQYSSPSAPPVPSVPLVSTQQPQYGSPPLSNQQPQHGLATGSTTL